MSQPTQELPPWFTAIVTTIVDTNGVPLTTSTSLLYLPLTYYGPSIPLGTDWTYGGLTPPPSTSTSPTSAIPTSTPITPPSISSPVTPSSESSSITPPPTPSSSISSTTTPSASISSTTSFSSVLSSSASPTSSLLPLPSNTSTAGRPSTIGVILGSVFGGIILIFVIGLYVCFIRRRNRHPLFPFASSPLRTPGLSPIDDFYMVTPQDLPREPGEGSPRMSGEEVDPFLTRSQSHNGAPQMQQTGPIGVAVPRPAPPVTPRPISGTQTSAGTGSSGTGSGYGTLVDVPTFGASGAFAGGLSSPAGPDNNTGYHQRRGPILSPSELSRLDEEGSRHHEPVEGPEYSPLLPPPRLDPDQFGVRASSPSAQPSTGTSADPIRHSQGSTGTKRSSFPIDPEEANNATVLTARRVRVEDLGPRSPPMSPTAPGSPTPLLGTESSDRGTRRGSGTWLSGFGLGGLASSIGRMSWFKGQDSPTASTSAVAKRSSQYDVPPTRPSYLQRALSDDELEAGRAVLLSSDPRSESRSARSRAVGLGAQGERPISSVSARSGTSGGTVYHDAQSSMRDVPSGLPSPALPRATTPASNQGQGQTSGQAGQSNVEHLSNEPPSYDNSNMYGPPSSSYPGATALSIRPVDHGVPIDILDLPAPPAILPSLSSSSLRDTASGSTKVGARNGLIMPPGLWQDTSTVTSTRRTEGTETPSFGSLAAQRHDFDYPSHGGPHQDDGPISIDVLEELPPGPGEGWRSMAGGGNPHILGPRRQTFGMPPHIIHPLESTASEQGSLHSMRSHLSPGSARSTGSAPASSRHGFSGSIGSTSSRPSAYSATPSSNSAGGIPLSHSGSFSNDGRRRIRPGSPSALSPTLSAFGSMSPPSHPSSPIPPRPMTAAFGPQRPPQALLPQGMEGSPDPATVGCLSVEPDRSTSPVSLQLPSVPWAAGLDKDWTPA